MQKKAVLTERRYFDFFDMKGILLEIIKIFSIKKVEFIRCNSEYYHLESADIILNNEIIGSFGELHPRLMKQFQVKQQIEILGSLEVDLLLKGFYK